MKNKERIKNENRNYRAQLKNIVLVTLCRFDEIVFDTDNGQWYDVPMGWGSTISIGTMSTVYAILG